MEDSPCVGEMLRWIESPYWQFLCHFSPLQPQAQVALLGDCGGEADVPATAGNFQRMGQSNHN